ncbi:MAG: class I SAM-dependent methyltransferase [Bacteroidota bacterium]
MTELELMVDLHKYQARQGPGSTSDTLRALGLTGIDLEHHSPLVVADIGCGTGGQTRTLAQHLKGKIIAVDVFSEVLDRVNDASQSVDHQHKIETVQQSMDHLSFEAESLDLIWSEGAIYNMGFESGIKNWSRFLKPGGCLAVSELTWITQTRPREIETYWVNEYPEIDTSSRKIELLEQNGLTLSGYFYLPETSWMDHYYKPLEEGFSLFLDRHDHFDLAKKVVEDHREEIAMYRKYAAYFSYGFYVARKK